MMKKPFNSKIVLLGNSNAGKSTVFESFFDSVPEKLYTPTLEPKIRKYTLKTKNADINIRIFDCPGDQGYFDIHGKKVLQGTDVAVIMYSVIDQESLLAVQYWIGQISQYLETIPVLIVANKIDLLENNSRERSAAIEQGKKIASVFQRVLKFSELPFLEITATKPQNALHVFNKAFSLLGEWISFSSTAHGAETTTSSPTAKNIFDDGFNVTISNPYSQLEDLIVTLVAELNQNHQNHPVTPDTATAIIEMVHDERHVKQALEQLERQKLAEILYSVTKDSQWLQKKNFLHLLLYTEFSARLVPFVIPAEELEAWAEKLAQFFVSTKDSLDYFWALDAKEQEKILKKAWSSNMDMIKLKQEIYFHYRSLTYRSKL
ncbi:MAG: GTPase domain-containing protein [Candidatus Hodarchaeales archaeon]